MKEKLLWLGIYLSLRAPLKTVKLFQSYSSAKEVLEYLKLKETEVLNLAEDELERAEKLGVKVFFLEELPALKELFRYPPLFLYSKGVFPKEVPLIAVIGTRKPTFYGKDCVKFFAKAFVESGVGIVSGFARGIDSIAHKVAVESCGYTIGVLGSGLDVIYPPENKGLLSKVIDSGGAVISEFPLGTKPRRENFPVRNRIISGLSEGILVVEAAKKSGTLITAKWALEQGKEVFAIPGSIFSSQSEGTNYLIKQGAILVTSPEEVLELLGLNKFKKDEKKSEQKEVFLEEEEKVVVNALSYEPVHVEELVKELNLSSFELLAILTELELKGLVEVLPGKYVKLKKS